MNFELKNFGKIAEADIKLDGITVICGNNNTGKSTVGKALFSFFNALYDYKSKIDSQKADKFYKVIRRIHSANSIGNYSRYSLLNYVSEHEGEFSQAEIEVFLFKTYGIKLSEEKLEEIVIYLNTPTEDILNESVYRYIINVMNGQIKNVKSDNDSRCYISGKFKEFTNTITIQEQTCKCELNDLIEHSAYYINNPFSLDLLNEPVVIHGINPMNYGVINAIKSSQIAINNDSMTDILDSVQNKKDLDDVRNIIKKAYQGDTVVDHGMYYYSENGINFDFRNLSAGLKSFALIERMLETGVLKRKDVLILDEPEIHLHSEWQIIYAELIVLLQKKFDLTILLVTHSFQFLESLNFFMEKYETIEKGNYYIPNITNNGIVFESCTDDLSKVRKSLKSGMYQLADMKLSYLSDEEEYDE